MGETMRAVGRFSRRRTGVFRYFPWLRFVFLGFLAVFVVLFVDWVAPKEVPDDAVQAKPVIALTWSGVLERERDLSGSKLIALTFDDGPDAATTSRLLDILKEKQVKATFFELGNRILAAPEVSARAVSEGHEVESHSVAHADLRTLSGTELRTDYERMQEIFREVLGYEPKYLRPPYGAVSAGVRGLPIVLMGWTVDSRDWESRNSAAILAEVKRASFDGAVILMHDIYDTTVDAVGPTIDWLKEQGYEFVTIEEMASLRGGELTPGVLYGDFSI